MSLQLLIISDKYIFLQDTWIYAMYNVDPRMTFVVIYEVCSRQKDKDQHVTTFITETSVQLRCNKVFESLKLTK